MVSAVTLEPGLEQLGQDDPRVVVAFRQYQGRNMEYDPEFLRLSLTDARELARALNYLVDLGSKAHANRVRSEERALF